MGSGSGRKAFIDQTVNFGASDDPMKKKDMAKVTRGVVQIPMVGGTIAFGYNKPGCNLKLTQEQAVKVAMGMIKNWKELGCKPGTPHLGAPFRWLWHHQGLHQLHAGLLQDLDPRHR